jgi:hypothetical protein
MDGMSTNNGVLQGPVTFVPGEDGQAFFFNGINADVRVPASSRINVGVLGALTIEAWVSPASLAEQPIAEWNSGSTYGAHFWLSTQVPSGGGGPGCLYANLRDTAGTSHTIGSPGGLLLSNTFQHVALTYSRTNGIATLYLNGAIIAQQNLGAFNPQTSYDLYFGLRPSNTPRPVYLFGSLDEVSLYNRALSASEIQMIYLSGATGKCPLGPAIALQPANRTATNGGSVTFTVTATGGQPLAYQWTFNTTNLVGATNSTLTLLNVQLSQAGNYAVFVGNAAGSVLSSNAVLTVLSMPKINGQPQPQLVYPGCSAFFSVSASGTPPLFYRWLKNSTNLVGQTNAVLSLPNVQQSDFGSYSVVVSNAYGTTMSMSVPLAQDHPPITGPNTITRFGVGGTRVMTSQLLSHDSDADGDPLSIVSVGLSSAAGGTVSLSNNWIYYAPPPGYTNSDTFIYTVTDGHCGGNSLGVVNVQVLTDNTPTGNLFVKNLGNGSFLLSFVGYPGGNYRLQYTDDLGAQTWQDLVPFTADSFGSFDYTDQPPANVPVRCYRCVTP